MKLSHEQFDQISVLRLKGDMTAEYCDQFKSIAMARMSNDVRDFVLDCSGLELVDSQGFETWLWLQETCGEQLGQLRIAALDETLNTVLEITRLASRFETHNNVDQAIASLQ